MIYGFIYDHPEYTVVRWAAFFQVSRSGYYAYLESREQRSQNEKSLRSKIKKIFDESGGTYGPDRICGVLRRTGEKASYRKISGCMAEMKLHSVHNRHRTRSLTDSRKAHGDGYPNLTKGKTFIEPRMAICSDITYLKSGEGFLYLCVVKDIATGEILGEAISENMKKEFVIQAFLNAQSRHKLKPGTIFHSDRGCQYTSKEFMDLLKSTASYKAFPGWVCRAIMPGRRAFSQL